MLYKVQAVASDTKPSKVTIEFCPDKSIVRMTDNVKEVIVKDDEMQREQLLYEYDEVRFVLPEDRMETVESITENFEDWWLYGTEDHTAPTLEERVTILEEILMEE